MKITALLMIAVVVFGLASCKPEVEYVDKKLDDTAPGNVTALTATAKDSRVLLTWTDATDSDVYGYEVSYDGTCAINRVAFPAMAERTMMVAPGAGGCYVSNLTNGTTYTFTVKTVDTSGNKSAGVTATATPANGNTMSITLTQGNMVQSGTTQTVVVTVNITTEGTVIGVKWKKDGSQIAKTLLADSGAQNATVDANDNKKWTFSVNATSEDANGTYTVAAIDSAGREETAQITINSFDFTPPAHFSNVTDTYSATNHTITLDWTEPTDSDFDHAEITYTYYNGTSDSTPSTAETITKGTTTKTFTGIDADNLSYTYSIVCVDTLGNRSSAYIYTVYMYLPEGFVAVRGATVSGAVVSGDRASRVFIANRTVTIPDMLVCDHEVTQAEFQTVMGTNPSNFNGSSGKEPVTGETQANRPVEQVSWYAAIAYCNKKSIAENLTPCYTVSGITDWANLAYSSIPTSSNSTWNAATCNFNAKGYRLPTEAEWEYIARGGNNGIPATQYTYSGSNTIGDVAWYTEYFGSMTHEVKKKDSNSLGIYDMSGNVWEWCWDWDEDDSSITSSTPATGASSGSYRVKRGGSWETSYVTNCSVASRSTCSPGNVSYSLGFRVVRSGSTN